MITAPASRLPVTVVTGFLGAGKSTLLRQLLLSSGLRLAVLVNEFGEVGIDGDLIRSCGFCPEEELDGRVVELANGCLCCTVQDEFLPVMQQLLQRADQLDGIVVETSGLALPLPLVQAFRWPEIRTRTRVTGVVTVVDGEALSNGSVVADPAALEAQRAADPSLDHLSDINSLFDDQLGAADLVLMSRADCLSEEAIQALQSRLSGQLRHGVSVLPMARGNVPAALLMGLDRPEEDEHHHDHSHVAMDSVSLNWQGITSKAQLETLLPALIADHGLLRLKGRAWLPGKSHPLQIQAVGPRLECWFDSNSRLERPSSDGLELVALGLSLDASGVQEQLKGGLA